MFFGANGENLLWWMDLPRPQRLEPRNTLVAVGHALSMLLRDLNRSYIVRTSWSARLVLLVLLTVCHSSHGFLIPVHREMTSEAVSGFANLTETQKRRIIDGSVHADLVEGDLPGVGGIYDRRYHFDSSFSYQAVMENFAGVARLIDGTLATKDGDPWEFGKALHAIEDFYSHSNYIPLFRDYVVQNGNDMVGAVPPLEQVLKQPKKYRRFIEMLKKDLRTGRYPDARWIVARDTDHGPPIGFGGMHKDRIGRDFHPEARQAATWAVVWYLRLYTGDPQARKDWVAIKAAFAAGTR